MKMPNFTPKNSNFYGISQEFNLKKAASPEPALNQIQHLQKMQQSFSNYYSLTNPNGNSGFT